MGIFTPGEMALSPERVAEAMAAAIGAVTAPGAQYEMGPGSWKHDHLASGGGYEVDGQVFTRAPPNLRALYQSAAHKYGDRTQIVDDGTGKRYTYRQVWDMSEALGAYLASRGIKPGDRVAISA